MTTGGGACYFVQFTQSYFFNTKFIWNYASIQGGGIGISQQCFVYFENVYFLGCSSDKGGVFLVSEESSLIAKNSTFENNFANTGGIFHSLENYNSAIQLIFSNFISNKGNDNLFNMLDSQIDIRYSNFINNTNTIFSLLTSKIYFQDLTIKNHSCNNLIIGCVINSQKCSITASNLFFSSINNLMEEGNVYLEETTANFSNLSFEGMINKHNIGSCFDIFKSSLRITFGVFQNYDSNCIFAKESQIEIDFNVFQNEEFNKGDIQYFPYGSTYLTSCDFISITNTIFQKNNLSSYGGAISIQANKKNYAVWGDIHAKLTNITFISNYVQQQGGAIFLSNANANISNCLFEGNIANEGGGIFFSSLGFININYFNRLNF